jgi:hypothetical protein
MNDIQKQALVKGIAFIKASGASYIVLSDGDTMGFRSDDMLPMTLTPPAAVNGNGKAKRKILNNFERDINYIVQMQGIDVGNTFKWARHDYPMFMDATVDPDHPMRTMGARAWGSFHSSVCAFARRRWGDDASIVSVSGETIEVLRVS